MSLEDLMIHDVRIEVYETVTGELMGAQRKWKFFKDSAARVQPASSSEVKEYEQRKWVADTSIQFCTDPQVTERHRIIFKGEVYDCKGSINWQEMDVHWTVACQKKSIPEVPAT
jgi:hypothetical protein